MLRVTNLEKITARAKIILQCELKAFYYNSTWGWGSYLLTDIIAQDFERQLNKCSDVIITFRTEMPAGYDTTRDWLVIDLISLSPKFKEDEVAWEFFVTVFTERAINWLAVGGDGRTTTIEIGDKLITMMDDPSERES